MRGIVEEVMTLVVVDGFKYVDDDVGVARGDHTDSRVEDPIGGEGVVAPPVMGFNFSQGWSQ